MRLTLMIVFAFILNAIGLAGPAVAAGVSVEDIQKICPTCKLSGTAPTLQACSADVSTSTVAPSPGDMINMMEDGENCVARSYGRGVGTIPGCLATEERGGGVVLSQVQGRIHARRIHVLAGLPHGIPE